METQQKEFAAPAVLPRDTGIRSPLLREGDAARGRSLAGTGHHTFILVAGGQRLSGNIAACRLLSYLPVLACSLSGREKNPKLL